MRCLALQLNVGWVSAAFVAEEPFYIIACYHSYLYTPKEYLV